MKHAWHSPKAARLYGYSVYEREDGTRVNVTEVRSNVKEPTSSWEDLKYVGLVGRMFESVKGEQSSFRYE